MSTTLTLSNESDSLDLNSVLMLGYGVQARGNITGFGLPPVSAQFVEGVGDGALYRNSKTLVRDVDLPVDIEGRTPAELMSFVSRFARILGGEAKLTVSDRNGAQWYMNVVRVGGGEYAYGSTSNNIQMVVTLRAADPYWTAVESTQVIIGSTPGSSSFLANLSRMPLAPSQTFGTIQLNNTGDVPVYPSWTVWGPGNNFKAISPSGEMFHWTGSLILGQSLIVQSRNGTVVDGVGANRYASMAAAPHFWALPPGDNTVTAELLGTTTDSKIVITFSPRKWMVI